MTEPARFAPSFLANCRILLLVKMPDGAYNGRARDLLLTISLRKVLFGGGLDTRTPMLSITGIVALAILSPAHGDAIL